MCFFFAFILLAIALVTYSLNLAYREPSGMGARLPTIAGITLSLGSFFFLPWVKFSPVSYLVNVEPEILGDYVSEVLAFILRLLGQTGVAAILSLLESIGGIPGWLLVVVIPTSDWLTRLTLILVPITGGLSLLWLAFTLFVNPIAARRIFGIGQAIFALMTALLLLSQIPTIDALGISGNLPLRFLTVISGARMSSSVWLAWLGLLLIGVGGLAEVISASESSRSDEQGY
jgi:hypothetical protein